MPLEQWSDKIVVVHLADDPQFIEDMQSLAPHRYYQQRPEARNEATSVQGSGLAKK